MSRPNPHSIEFACDGCGTVQLQPAQPWMCLTLSLLLVVGLAGCVQRDLFRIHPQPVTLSAPGPCGAQARQRLDDAIMSGNAEGYEKAIFDNENQACLAAVQRFGQP